jgi:CheY-like chemotaxis protein
MSATPPILAAEDEETDALILRLAFERARVTNPLIVVGDGQEAIDYLEGRGAYADRAAYPLPVLLLLDLKMPRLSGFDVLAWLATRSDFKELPAIVLSSSSDDSDIRRAKAAGARDYFVKPHNLSELVTIMQTVHTRHAAKAPTNGG